MWVVRQAVRRMMGMMVDRDGLALSPVVTTAMAATGRYRSCSLISAQCPPSPTNLLSFLPMCENDAKYVTSSKRHQSG